MRRYPVHSRALHRHRADAMLFQPCCHLLQFRCCGSEAAYVPTAAIRLRCTHPMPLTSQIHTRHIAADDGQPFRFCHLPTPSGATARVGRLTESNLGECYRKASPMSNRLPGAMLTLAVFARM